MRDCIDEEEEEDDGKNVIYMALSNFDRFPLCCGDVVVRSSARVCDVTCAIYYLFMSASHRAYTGYL